MGEIKFLKDNTLIKILDNYECPNCDGIGYMLDEENMCFNDCYFCDGDGKRESNK